METLRVLLELSWNAPLVTFASGVAGSAGSGWLAHAVQARKARVLPSLPSHAEALAAPDDATRFFAAVHDLSMAVTEAWNAVRARRAGGRVEEVIRRDVLARCRDAVHAGADALRARLAAQAARAAEMIAPIEAFDASWTYRSRDNYRTETYTVTVTDSKGKSRTETRTRQVYVNTNHWFDYHSEPANRARRLLDDWVARCRSTPWRELGVHAHRVDVRKLDPTERSFLERLIRATVLEDPEAVVSEADVERYANQWLLGTRIDARLAALADASRTADAERGAKYGDLFRSETHYSYVTTSRSHPGPPGYQAARSLQRTLEQGLAAWRDVESMLSTCQKAADDLVSWAEDPERVESDRQYADAAVAAYQAAFPASEIEIDQLPSHGMTAAIAGGTGAIAAIATWALHPAGWNLLG